MKTVLFICTGNYYRSRFAEIYFNHLSRESSMRAHAFSRGLRPNPEKNKGDLSMHTVSFLSALKIPLNASGSRPLQLQIHDLYHANIIIVLDEKEHRPMMNHAFPDWENKVEYWQFEDDYLISPDQVLPRLKEKVKDLIESLRKAN